MRGPRASWGHRTTNHPARNETFYGYYLQAATTVKDEHGPQVPELVRRIHLDQLPSRPARPDRARARAHDQRRDPGRRSARRLRLRLPSVPATFALPAQTPRCASTSSRTCTPTTAAPTAPTMARPAATGASTAPPPHQRCSTSHRCRRAATAEQTAAHDHHCAELATYKLSPITALDHDGYHRVICPAAQRKAPLPARVPPR